MRGVIKQKYRNIIRSLCAIIGTVERQEAYFVMKLMKRNHSLTLMQCRIGQRLGLFRGAFNQSVVVCITQFTMRCCAALIIPNWQCGLRQRAIKSLAIEMR